MHVHIHGHVHGDVDGHGGPLGVVRWRGPEGLPVVLGCVAVGRDAAGGVVASGRTRRVDDRVLQGEQHVGHTLAVDVGRAAGEAVAPGAAPAAGERTR
jgi:hypothetical protein